MCRLSGAAPPCGLVVCIFTGKRLSVTLTLAKVNRKFVSSKTIAATIFGKVVKTLRL